MSSQDVSPQDAVPQDAAPEDPAARGNITLLLGDACEGDERARSDLWEAVYDELRGIAARKMAGETPGHTLQPTALVHEAYVRLLGGERVAPKDRAYFFASAARAMSRILIERGRRRHGVKVHADENVISMLLGSRDGQSAEQNDEQLDALESALETMRTEMPEVHEVVMLRFFAGLGVEGVAEALGVSTRTVKRKWSFGRAWLSMQLSGESG